MTPPPPDRSRDRRIEDPTNLWIVHPVAQRLLAWFVARGISANAVSLGGLALGTGSALAFANWREPGFAVLALVLAVGWLIADGLDGMIARATGTASAWGRILDGLCDHGVFALIYGMLALSIGTAEGWALAIGAGCAHAVQSSLYEGERARFHRRVKGLPAVLPPPSRNPLVRLYDSVAFAIDRVATRFDAVLGGARDPRTFGEAYGRRAVAPMRLMALLSANMRVYAAFLACLAGNPHLFWWFELGPLTLICIIGLAWHRAVERRMMHDAQPDISPVQRT
jgi:CDP-diacylglycerol--serine O-phosphatidyltransferase